MRSRLGWSAHKMLHAMKTKLGQPKEAKDVLHAMQARLGRPKEVPHAMQTKLGQPKEVLHAMQAKTTPRSGRVRMTLSRLGVSEPNPREKHQPLRRNPNPCVET